MNRRARFLHPHVQVHRIALQVLSIDDDAPDMHPDPGRCGVVGQDPVGFGHGPAGPRGAFYGVRGAGEFGEKAILYQLEGAAAMARSPA